MKEYMVLTIHKYLVNSLATIKTLFSLKDFQKFYLLVQQRVEGGKLFILEPSLLPNVYIVYTR